jgi:hypothetical protein
MSRLSPETAWHWIVLDHKQDCRSRCEALTSMRRPSVNMLQQIISNRNTPRRLRVLAVRLYEIAIARRELNANA